LFGDGFVAADPPILGDEPPFYASDPKIRVGAERVLAKQNATLSLWWLDQLTTTRWPFVEKMTWFWHGHFATGASSVRSARLMLAQNQTLRMLCLRSFDALVAAMVVDPAMLIWLDGRENRVGAPNENLARELMELFTLGVGNYTEADVREAARALTGWTVDKPSVASMLDPDRHDSNPKTVLGEQVSDAGSLASVLVARPESARFVVSRIWFRLVSADPPPSDVLARLIAAYGPARDLRALMQAVATDPAFLDVRNILVKQPVEWAVGLMRALVVRPAAFSQKEADELRGVLRSLGQVPFEPPSVGGWPAGSLWLTTGTGLGRLSLAQLVARNADLSMVADVAPALRAEAVRDLLGVDRWSQRTAAALSGVKDDPTLLVAVGACAPEYVVSR
jgi:uncharacterized protein (DUF1800 family)